VRNKLTSGFAGAAFCLAASGLAFAADMPLKAPPPPPAPVWSWTGFYVGGELGGEWADTTWTTTSFIVPNTPTFVDASSPRNFDPSSVRAGGYVGYNWQLASQWVAGVEADLAYANRTVTTAGIPGCSIGCEFPSGPGVDTSSVKMGWDAGIRAGLGYLVTPNLLAYGTGGVAWQDIQTSATCQYSDADPLCFGFPGNPFKTVTNKVIRTGGTIGGGLETRVSGNWLVRGEYRYSYFGTWSNQFNLSIPGEPGFGEPSTVNSHLKISTQIATFGFAYKFDSPSAVVARY
jgi:outer membrane immunogenic protein